MQGVRAESRISSERPMPNPSEAPTRFPSQILCGLDLEGRAGPAVTAAVWLSETLGAPLELVHAFPPRPLLWGKEADMPEWEHGTEITGQILRESLRQILAEAPAGLALRTSAEALRLHVRSGPPVRVIVDRAQAARADLVVLGAHEKHGRFDFGNTVRGVLAYALRGVWVQREPLRPVRRILVPLDLSPYSLEALAIARDLAESFGARLTAFQSFELPLPGAAVPDGGGTETSRPLSHLVQSERSLFEAAMSDFDWRGVPHDARFERGDPADVVLSLQKDHDLIVMATHGRTGLSAVLLGAVAHTVLNSARIPVLALRHPRGTYLI